MDRDGKLKIYQVVLDCEILFHNVKLLQVPSKNTISDRVRGEKLPDPSTGIRHDEPATRIENQQHSFNMWVRYTGALAAGSASLDDRLQYHPEIREMVMELLHMAMKNLQKSK